MLEKIAQVPNVEITPLGIVKVTTPIHIVENGIKIAATDDIHTIAPGQDYSSESAQVQAVCAAVHTPAVVAAFTAAG